MKITPLKTLRTDGFSLIELIIVLLVMAIIATIAIPNLLKARRTANEASAVSTVRLLTRSEAAFRLSSTDKTYATIDQLFAAGHLDEVLGHPPYAKNGYIFAIQVFPATSTAEARYNVQANPVSHSLIDGIVGTGSKNFGANESGAIFQTMDTVPVTFDETTRVPQGTAIAFGQ